MTSSARDHLYMFTFNPTTLADPPRKTNQHRPLRKPRDFRFFSPLRSRKCVKRPSFPVSSFHAVYQVTKREVQILIFDYESHPEESTTSPSKIPYKVTSMGGTLHLFWFGSCCSQISVYTKLYLRGKGTRTYT